MPALVPPVDSELEQLLSYLDQQRYFLRIAAHGLSEGQARAAPTPSSLSVGGLIKHVTQVEATWTELMNGTPSRDDERYLRSFTLVEEEKLSEILDGYHHAGERTDGMVRRLGDPNAHVPVPKGVPWFPQDVDHWTVRWVVLHLIEETSRHAGHADIIREAIDGATAFPLLAAVESWPASPWLQPWEPAVS